MTRARQYGAAAVVRLVSSSAAVDPEGVEGEEETRLLLRFAALRELVMAAEGEIPGDRRRAAGPAAWHGPACRFGVLRRGRNADSATSRGRPGQALGPAPAPGPGARSRLSSPPESLRRGRTGPAGARRSTRDAPPPRSERRAGRTPAWPPATARQPGRQTAAYDREAYKQRNTAERCINRLKQWLGLATHYDKTVVIYLAAHHLAGVFVWSARCLEATFGTECSRASSSTAVVRSSAHPPVQPSGTDGTDRPGLRSLRVD